jgi:hypothetical protein
MHMSSQGGAELNFQRRRDVGQPVRVPCIDDVRSDDSKYTFITFIRLSPARHRGPAAMLLTASRRPLDLRGVGLLPALDTFQTVKISSIVDHVNT